jgi:biopolymer transport protein ExbD
MGGGSDSSDDAITGINVTPLVDIVLVLLIIFMVTAKLIVSKSVPLDLPKAASGSDIQTVFSIVLAADGSTQIDSKTVPSDDTILGTEVIERLFARHPLTRILDRKAA